MRWSGDDARSSKICMVTVAAHGIPLYQARRTTHTGADLLTDRQRRRLTILFDVEEHVQVEAT